MDSPTIGWGGSEPPAGDAGVWCYQVQPECLVQHCGVGKEEGWWPMVLHWLLLPERLHKKDSYPLPRIQEALESLVGAGHFSCLDLKWGFWQIKMEEALKQYTAFTVDNLGFSKCNCIPFGLCNAPVTFQQLMQNYLGKLNLIYCLIYLDNLIMFSQTTEEHLNRLCIVFDRLREYNLKLKPSKYSLFKEEINYLAHWVSKQGVQPSDANLKAIAECALPWTYMEICALLGLIGHYRQFIKGFAWIAKPLNEHLAGKGANRKSEWVSLSEDVLEAFQALKQACMSSPVLAFTNYTKDFLLKTDTSKEGLGAVLSQKQADGHYHPVTYGSRALTAHEKNYHSTKLEFLVLKWAITEHFKEYLLYLPFLVRTDNNPLSYIMTMPNLNATGHWWVGSLAKFNFWLEYQKGQDNMVADMLSWITTHLDLEAMQSILDGVTLGAAQRAERDDPAMVEGDHNIEKGGTCYCWASPSWNACYQLGHSPKRRPRTRCSIALVKRPKRRLIWGHSWGSMLPVRRAKYYGGIAKISWSSKMPSICTPHPEGRMRIYYSS